MGPGLNERRGRPPDAPEAAAAERQETRLQAAIDAGWAVRFDPVRLEYAASRELVTARTLDGLLDAVEAAGNA